MTVPISRADEAVTLPDVRRHERFVERRTRKVEIECEPGAHYVNQVVGLEDPGDALAHIVHALRRPGVLALDLVGPGDDELLKADQSDEVGVEEVRGHSIENFLVVRHRRLDVLFHDDMGGDQLWSRHAQSRITDGPTLPWATLLGNRARPQPDHCTLLSGVHLTRRNLSFRL